jgi:DNA-binding NtrC family response regulator
MQKNLPSVFIVDDEHLIAETLSLILRKNGFAAKSFTDSHEALSAARDATPDLLLTDVMMPGLTGVELAIAIQKMCPGCKVILFSGHAGTGDVMSTARERGSEFRLLDKPLHPNDLLRQIRQENPAWALEPA